MRVTQQRSGQISTVSSLNNAEFLRTGKDDFSPVAIRTSRVEKLELQLERELNAARGADLVQRVEAAALAASPELVVQHVLGLAEMRRGHVVDRTAEVRVVEDVEQIGAGLKPKFLRQAKLTAESDVPLRYTERDPARRSAPRRRR